VKTIVVLGAGLVGGLIARDLVRDPGIQVIAVDASEEPLAKLAGVPRLATERADLADPAKIARAVAGALSIALPT